MTQSLPEGGGVPEGGDRRGGIPTWVWIVVGSVVGIAVVVAAVLIATSGDDDTPDPPVAEGDATSTAEPSDEPDTQEPSSQPSEPETPYDGPPLPGLSAAPEWSVRDATEAFAVGENFGVEVQNEDGTRLTLQLRDGASGEVIESFDLTGGYAAPATWHGEPAIEVSVVEEVEAEGVQEGDQITTVTIYDANGSQLGQVEQPLSAGEFKVEDGWKIAAAADDTSPTAVEISDAAGGSATVSSGCPPEDDYGCMVDLSSRHASAISTGPETLLVAAGLTFTWADADDSALEDEHGLVATDLASGEQVWTSWDLAVPPDALPGMPEVLGEWRGDLLLSWDVDSERTDASVIAVHDPQTGELLSYSPVLRADDLLVAAESALTTDAAGTTAVVGSVPAVAWDLESGAELWQQGEDERELVPQAIGNGVLYGEIDEELMAFDLATRELLSDDGELVVPIFNAAGQGAVLTDGNVHIFTSEPIN